MMKQKISAAALLIGALLVAPASAHADMAKGWAGVDFGPKSYYTYVGAVAGLNHQNILNQNGFLLRVSGGYGEFTYDTVNSASGHVDGKASDGDLMVGYGYQLPQVRVTAYLGGDLQDQSLSPSDIRNTVSGTEAGVKGQLELEMTPVNHIGANAAGNYSTAFNTYWTHAGVGYDFGVAKFGPEVGFVGNKAYDQQRYGAALTDIKVIGSVKGKIYGGYADTQGNGASGAYGGVGLSANF